MATHSRLGRSGAKRLPSLSHLPFLEDSQLKNIIAFAYGSSLSIKPKGGKDNEEGYGIMSAPYAKGNNCNRHHVRQLPFQ